jgi:hypothetical protein
MEVIERKEQMLRLFLQFIFKYIEPKNAIIVGLGGEGREAVIWHEVGIVGQNGWMIERDKSRSRHLIREVVRQLGYQYHPSLATFPRAFGAINGREAKIDALHLDFNGTLESNIPDAKSLIPVVARGRGRCLAITVADARANQSVENFSEIENRLGRLLGYRYDRMLNCLYAERGEERELAVMREVGVFNSLLDVLKFYGRYAIPVQLSRYAYVSHTSGQGFPMRTYIFRFSKKPKRMTEKKFACSLYRMWFQQPLHNLNHPAQSSDRTKETVEMKKTGTLQTPELDAFIGMASAEVRAQFEARMNHGVVESMLQNLVTDLRGVLDKYATNGHVPVTPAGKPETSTSVRGKGKDASKHSKKRQAAPNNGQLLDIGISMLKARAKSADALSKLKESLRLKHFPRKKGGMRIIGGWHACTVGGFKSRFLKRLAADRPTEMETLLPKLAEWYSKIEGKELTAEDLRKTGNLKEAGL